MRNHKIIFIIIFAFINRIIALFLLNRHIFPETWEPDTIALNLLQKKGFVINYLGTVYRSYYCPVYVFFCAAFHFITKYNYFIIELAQVILSTFTCYFVYLIAAKIYNKKIGLISSFLIATHPGLIIYSTKLSESTLVVFLIVAIFWLTLTLDWTRIYNNLLMGISIGLGILTRSTLVVFLPAYFVYLWYSSNKNREFFRALCVVSLSTILVILPWTLRNYAIHKRWVFITTTTAVQFWIGNNPAASGSALTPDGRSVLDAALKEVIKNLQKLNEIEQYDFFYKEAFRFIRSNQSLFIKRSLEKFFYFWWFSPQVGLLYPRIWTIIYKAYYSLFLLFSILGSYFSFNKLYNTKKPMIISLFVFFFLISLLHSLCYVEIRHRWGIEPLMAIFCAYGLTTLRKDYN